MKYGFALLLGAFLGAGLGLGGVVLWLGLVTLACLIADACTARARRARYLAECARAGRAPSGLF
jgi:hypothetical protein